jgi:hypothetical protein
MSHKLICTFKVISYEKTEIHIHVEYGYDIKGFKNFMYCAKFV